MLLCATMVPPLLTFTCVRRIAMRRLAAMSVRTSQCDCTVHPTPGISEILPPALTASLKVRSLRPAGSPCPADERKPVSDFIAVYVHFLLRRETLVTI